MQTNNKTKMVGLMKVNKVLGKPFHELCIVHVVHVHVFAFEV